MKMKPARVLRSAAAIALACSFAIRIAAQESTPPTAWVGAKLIPIVGPVIESGTLLVEQGKITAVGVDVAIPPNARVIDATGKVLMPGLVCSHSHIGGVGGADGSATIQPDVRVLDSINVRDSGFRRAVAGGLTTLNIMPGSGHLMSGQTVYVKLRGATTIEELAYRSAEGEPLGGLKMANGTNPLRDPPFSGTRGKSAALVRREYVRALEYRDQLARLPLDSEKRPTRDLGLETLLEAIAGRRVVHHHTHRADDIMTVLRLREEFGFRVVLHHLSEGYKVANEIARAQVPCSVILVDSPGGKLEAAQLSFSTAGVLERAGVKVAFHTDDWITDSRLFLRMAALGVRAGMTRDGALRALTMSGAEMLDLGARVGSLEVGKDADIIVLDGDPLSVYTKVLETWVEGVRVFDRSDPKDRLYAVGGYGAGHDQQPYFCCFDGHEHKEGE
ncbi:MAG: amidohydrolase family protein [Planctomycetota bacterium]